MATLEELLEAAMKVGARNNRMDAKTIQAMHDLSVQLGASCPDMAGDGEGDSSKAISKREDVNPKEGKQKYGDVSFADEKNKKYPIDTEEHIRAAWNYINKEGNAGKYDASEVATIKRKIVAAWKEKIDKEGPPSAKSMSLDEKSSKIRAAVHASLGTQVDNMGMISSPGWIEYVYDDFVILNQNGTRYQINYSIDADGTVTVDGDQVPVEMDWKPLKSARMVWDRFAYAKSLGLAIPDKDLATKLAVKKVSADEIKSYTMIWGDPDKIDVEREFFTQESDFWDKTYGKSPRPLTWDHDQDPNFKADTRIGTITDWGDDDIGRWYAATLDRSHKYRKAIDGLIEEGALGSSSDSVIQYIQRQKTKSGATWLAVWPWVGSALTTTPAEPRLLASVEYAKSIGFELPFPEAPDIEQARAMKATLMAKRKHLDFYLRSNQNG